MTVESLKKEARRHEQREEWIKALDLYLQAIDRQAEEDEPDIALHNRVGDLQVRLGDLDGAVGNYERAISLYLDAELPNNAIAVCRKIVRHDPERPVSFLRMGQIRAKQGFLVDARQNFLTYAEMMQARGDTEEAFRALEEFVDLAPEDVETRLFLAEQLMARDRSDEALRYLADAHRAVTSQGDSAMADDILLRIRAIDPDHPVPEGEDLAPPESAEDVESPVGWGGAGFEPTSLRGDITLDDVEPVGEPAGASETTGALETAEEVPEEAGEEWPPSFGGEGLADAEEAGAEREGARADEEAVGAGPATEDATWDAGDLQITGFGTDDDVDEIAPADLDEVPTSEVADELAVADELETEEVSDLEEAEGEGEAGVAADDLPLLHFDVDDLPAEEDEEPVGVGLDLDIDLEEPAPAPVEEEPAVEGEAPVEEEAPSVEEEAPVEDPVVSLRDRVQNEPNDAGAWRRLADALFSTGSPDEGRDALERAHRLYAEQGDPEEAIRTVRELLVHEPHRIELRQRVVEYAHQTDDNASLIQAFLELADALRADGEDVKAGAVFEQVLELDPGNERANEALGASGAAPREPEPGAAEPEVAEEVSEPRAEGDYVDLGAMVLEGQGEATTRWVVEAEEPTGDEEADFARMLSQFKEKVAENISTEDARSHYDLGTAYKEMGLLREAIGEFQQALRARPHNLATFEMLGQCFLDLGDPEVAIRTLERGLDLPTDVEDDLLGVYYWLAQAYEQVGNQDTAREFYERIFSLDINFKDVTERLATLR